MAHTHAQHHSIPSAACRMLRVTSVLLIATLLCGCAASRYDSPEAMAEHQRKRIPYLATFYPLGTPRAVVLASYPPLGEGGRELIWYEETFLLPITEPVILQSSWPGTERMLTHLIATAPLLCDTEPARVDIFMADGDAERSYPISFCTFGHYVFYDEQDRVLIALEAHWD